MGVGAIPTGEGAKQDRKPGFAPAKILMKGEGILSDF